MDIFFSETHVFDFLGKNAFMTRNHKFWDFLKILISLIGLQPLHAKKHFGDKSFVETSVRENVYPLGPPTWFCVTANFTAACVRYHVLK